MAKGDQSGKSEPNHSSIDTVAAPVGREVDEVASAIGKEKFQRRSA